MKNLASELGLTQTTLHIQHNNQLTVTDEGGDFSSTNMWQSKRRFILLCSEEYLRTCVKEKRFIDHKIAISDLKRVVLSSL